MRAISVALKDTAPPTSTKHCSSLGVAGGTGVGAGVQAGRKWTNPLAAPIYRAAWPNDSASPTSAGVTGPARSKLVTAKLDKTRAMSLRDIFMTQGWEAGECKVKNVPPVNR